MTQLALPVSPALTLLTVFLPVLAAANAFGLPHLVKRAKVAASASWRLLLPIALQVLQLVLATVLATLSASDASPSATRGCMLETQWKRFWTGHDATRIRAIQDALSCCGFRTVKDMAWPFPRGSPGSGGPGSGGGDCAKQFDRILACRVPWENAMQSSVGAGFGVAVTVAVLQFVSIVMMRSFAGARFQDNAWGRVFERSFAQQRAGGDDQDGDDGYEGNGGGLARRDAGTRRPLLRELPQEVDADDDADDGYGRVEREANPEGNAHGDGGYGTTGTGRQNNPWEVR